jgi:glucosamine-6-phosphate deaminase
LGPVAVQLLGLGSNGHIAFNEPGSPWDSLTRVVDLHEQTLRDNARFFEDTAQMPTRAITQGIATIKRASAILLVVFGGNKLKALKDALDNPGLQAPASSLFDHPNLTLITDLDLS